MDHTGDAKVESVTTAKHPPECTCSRCLIEDYVASVVSDPVPAGDDNIWSPVADEQRGTRGCDAASAAGK